MAPTEDVKGEEAPKPEIVKKLEELDDKYLELQKQYDKEVAALAKKYTEKQQPFLDKRTEALSKGSDDSTGTPACKGFWLQAMKNHEIGQIIEEHDEPVLQYLKDISKEDIDAEDPDKGYTLKFKFAPNPYFEQTELCVTWHYGETNPYNQETEITKMVATDIEWKEGKDVTVEKTVKKVKGGGAKKAKQKGKETIEPRESFFRLMFRTMALTDEEVPEDLGMFMDEDEDIDPEEAVEMFLSQTDEFGCAVKDALIPFAVRWYTGEAKVDDDDDDDEDSEEESDEDDDDESESEDEAPKGKKGGKKGGAAKPDGKKEECKQQ